MLAFEFLDKRPIIVAIAGPNGSGKSTFFATHLADCGLRFVSADDIAFELDIGPCEAAEAAVAIRESLVERGESFVFATVLSDQVGEKVDVLAGYAARGFEVVMIFIRIKDAATLIQRFSMRASQDEHDAPDAKLLARFDRTQSNFARAIKRLPHVFVFDNSDLSHPYRLVERYQEGKRVDDHRGNDNFDRIK